MACAAVCVQEESQDQIRRDPSTLTLRDICGNVSHEPSLPNLLRQISADSRMTKGSRQSRGSKRSSGSAASLQGERSKLAQDATQHGLHLIRDEVELMEEGHGSEDGTRKFRWMSFVADERMYPTLRAFVRANRDVFSMCKITGTQSVINVIKAALGKQDIHVGPVVSEPPMGGLAELATLLVNNKIGVVFSFPDPTELSAAEHVDKTSFHRLINVHNVPHATNPTTADMLVSVLRKVLMGESTLMPSMTEKVLKLSPAVEEYNKRQSQVIKDMQARAVTTSEPEKTDNPQAEEKAGAAGKEEKTEKAGKSEKRSPKKKKGLGLGTIEESVLEAQDTIALHETHDTCMEATHEHFRCLALIAHNHMKPAMQDFVKTNSELLKNFRLTGTHSTMTMLETLLGEGVRFGTRCSSGPLGGDAEIMAQLHMEDLGGVIFFVDPLDAHPHIADVEMTVRQTNLYNVVHAPNPATALALTEGLKNGTKDRTLLPSFVETQVSPVLAEKFRQERRAWFRKVARYAISAAVILYSIPVALGVERAGWGWHHHLEHQLGFGA